MTVLLRAAPATPVTPATANLTANATAQLQEAMMASAASVLYVLLLLPALARNQSIGYAPPYFGAPAGYPAGYPAYGYPSYPAAGYPALGATPGLPPLYTPTGSLSGTPPYSGLPGVGVGSQGVGPLGLGYGGYGFPSGWPARPLGPLAAALATAYPTLFAALTGPCRSWCRAPNLPLLFPPSNADAEPEPFPFSRDRPVLRVLRAVLRGQDSGHDERGPLMRLLFPED